MGLSSDELSTMRRQCESAIDDGQINNPGIDSSKIIELIDQLEAVTAQATDARKRLFVARQRLIRLRGQVHDFLRELPADLPVKASNLRLILVAAASVHTPLDEE